MELQPAFHGSSSSNTLYCDFNEIPCLNVWTREQKRDVTLVRLIINMFIQLWCAVFETALLGSTLVCILYQEQKYISEFVWTLGLWILASLLTISLKVVYQKIGTTPVPFCSNRVGGLWNGVLLLLKPFRYMRAMYHRNSKMSILGREYIHGQTVSRAELDFIVKINLEEFTDARDDLHEIFIARIPMAILQFYYFYQSHIAGIICAETYGYRFFIVVLNILAALQILVQYEWKRKLYLHSLHVQSMILAKGRYVVPTWNNDRTTSFLRFLIRVSFFLSRLLLVFCAAQMSWGHGLASIIILFIFNLIIVGIAPGMLCIVENLPWGITTFRTRLVNHWLNTLSGISTRCHQLSSFSIKIRSWKCRFPFFLMQIIPFGMSFFLLFCTTEVLRPPAHLANQPEHVNLPNETTNATICENHEKWSGFARIVNGGIWSMVYAFNIVSHDPVRLFKSILFVHWVMFFVHILTNLVYLRYTSGFGKEDERDDYFPPIVSLAIFQKLFRKILAIPKPSTQQSLSARILLLLSIDNKAFNDLYGRFNRGDDSRTVRSKRWWDDRIRYVLERTDSCRTRYREDPPSIPELDTLPIGVEIHAASAAIEGLMYSNRLFMLCANRVDQVLSQEMTSQRLEATIEMLEISKKELLLLVNSN